MVRHQYTEADKELIRLHYKRGKIAWLARTIGVTESSIRSRAYWMGVRCTGWQERFWADKDIELLEDMAGNTTMTTMSRRLHRSVKSIRMKAFKCGIKLNGKDGWYSAFEVSEICGVNTQRVTDWIKRGKLKAERNGQDIKGVAWRIKRESLSIFLRRHPLEISGRNIDFLQIVDVLVGIEIERSKKDYGVYDRQLQAV